MIKHVGNRHINIHVTGMFSVVSPWPRELEAALTYTTTKKVYRRGYVQEHHFLYFPAKEFLPCGSPERGLIYTGNLERVMETLTTANIGYTVTEGRDAIDSSKMDLERLQSLRPRQIEAIDMMLTNHNGTVQCPAGFGKSYIITQVARVVKDTTILIITAKADVHKELYKRLQGETEEFHKKVGKVGGGGKYKRGCELIVCTSRSLHLIPEDWPDIVIFDEVHGAGAPNVAEALLRFSKCQRFYGFSASARGRGDGSNKLVEGQFGPIRLEISYDEAVALGTVAKMQVRMVKCKCDIKAYKDDIAKQRYGYWQNDHRNSLIGGISKHLHRDERLLVIVSNIEHLLNIWRYMPYAKLVYGDIDQAAWDKYAKLNLVQNAWYDQMAKVDAEAVKEELIATPNMHVIATKKWREGIDIPALRVTVRADGSGSAVDAVQISGRGGRVHEDKDYGIIYDFYDDFGEGYEKKSITRKGLYKDQNWEIIDYDS